MGFLRNLRVSAAVLAIACAMPALADDPHDPRMTPEAIARDSATIRRLNREQLDYVQRRDAGYAQGWRDHAEAGGIDRQPSTQRYASDRRDYDAMRADYAEQRRHYDAEMRAWRQDVADCRAGYYERCDGR